MRIFKNIFNKTDHMVCAPKYRGKILTGDVAMITEGIICKTCKELDIEIIEIAVKPDHVHIFFKYPPKYSLSFIAKRLKGRTSRDPQERISPSQRMVRRTYVGTKLFPWFCWEFYKTQKEICTIR
ncbi:MAG: IS200/IS605 family transposase [Candidatus Methanoperedens sp.]|nr:IS200/IS605 family transposase [Candidatus Methanoperedens sp.]